MKQIETMTTDTIWRFIGGTGRSGTTVLGRCLSQHPDVFFINESKFLADGGGLGDMLTGESSMRGFRAAMLEHFLPMLHRQMGISGLADPEELLPPERLQGALDRAFAHDDPLEAGRLLTDELLALMCNASGRTLWVEKTPLSITMADLLFAMNPQTRYVHIFRDPRDVCASVLTKPWGPRNVSEFIDWWLWAMTEGLDRRSQCPPEHYLTLSLESLAAEPQRMLGRVLEHLDIAHGAQTLSACAAALDPERTNIGRHATDIDRADAARIQAACLPVYAAWKEIELADWS